LRAEADRRTALNNSLRDIRENLRLNYANLANDFFGKCEAFKSSIAGSSGSLEDQAAALHSSLNEATALADGIPQIEAADALCNAANIEINEHTEHSVDDLYFASERVVKVRCFQLSCCVCVRLCVFVFYCFVCWCLYVCVCLFVCLLVYLFVLGCLCVCVFGR